MTNTKQNQIVNLILSATVEALEAGLSRDEVADRLDSVSKKLENVQEFSAKDIRNGILNETISAK